MTRSAWVLVDAMIVQTCLQLSQKLLWKARITPSLCLTPGFTTAPHADALPFIRWYAALSPGLS